MPDTLEEKNNEPKEIKPEEKLSKAELSPSTTNDKLTTSSPSPKEEVTLKVTPEPSLPTETSPTTETKTALSAESAGDNPAVPAKETANPVVSEAPTPAETGLVNEQTAGVSSVVIGCVVAVLILGVFVFLRLRGVL